MFWYYFKRSCLLHWIWSYRHWPQCLWVLQKFSLVLVVYKSYLFRYQSTRIIFPLWKFAIIELLPLLFTIFTIICSSSSKAKFMKSDGAHHSQFLLANGSSQGHVNRGSIVEMEMGGETQKDLSAVIIFPLKHFRCLIYLCATLCN